ncbi:MAG: nitroreductase family protein [Sedimentisphaerales bacterium]
MDLYETIKKRYSCRSYSSKPIEPEKLKKIFEAARQAPSAKNLQDWRFVIVTDEEIRKQIAIAANEQMFIATAPAIVVGCSITDYVMRCDQKISSIDVAIAMEHIALAATAEGLATCWIGSFYPEKVKKVLDIPKNIEIIELMPIGYPADKEIHRPREVIDKIVCYEKWMF